MPAEDGYTLLKQVRLLPADRGGTIPAIALTAHSREGDRDQAIGAGCWLPTPYSKTSAARLFGCSDC